MPVMGGRVEGRRISRLVVPLDVAEEMATGLLLRFIRERLRRGDPGPLTVVDGVGTTPQFDQEQAHPWNLEWVARYTSSGEGR